MILAKPYLQLWYNRKCGGSYNKEVSQYRMVFLLLFLAKLIALVEMFVPINSSSTDC